MGGEMLNERTDCSPSDVVINKLANMLEAKPL